MFDTLLILLDVFFPYIRYPFFLMIFIISALTIYLLLNIKTTYHRAHYTMIVSVVVLCIFQAIPVSEDRKNEQLEKAEKLLQIVEKEKHNTTVVLKLSAKLRRSTTAMLKKGYFNFSNVYTISTIRHDLEFAISKKERFKPLVNVKPETIKASVQPPQKQAKTEKPEPEHIVLKEVPIVQAEQEINTESASEAVALEPITTAEVHEISTEYLDQPTVVVNEPNHVDSIE